MNLKGREPAGIVSPGEQMEAFCAELRDDLLDIVEPVSGLPAVSRVMLARDVCSGPFVDRLPDLLVEWSDAVQVGSKVVHDGPSCLLRLTSPKIGTVEGEYTYCRTGDHTPQGLFVASGPGIAPGELGRAASIMDFAPTFLQCFGLPVADLDGTPIPEICSPEIRRRMAPDA